LVSLIESLATEVIVSPLSENLVCDRIEIVTTVLVAVIIIVLMSETVCWISRLRFQFFEGSGIADILLHIINTRQLCHVVDDLVVKVRVMVTS